VPIRIALREDTSIVREGVPQLLAVAPEVEIGAAVGGPALLRQACDQKHPDVVLTDVRMRLTPHRRGGGAAAEIDRAKQLLESGAITQA
jgi:DNA-binding NarL/FixJ family response regulator